MWLISGRPSELVRFRAQSNTWQSGLLFTVHQGLGFREHTHTRVTFTGPHHHAAQWREQRAQAIDDHEQIGVEPVVVTLLSESYTRPLYGSTKALFVGYAWRV